MQQGHPGRDGDDADGQVAGHRLRNADDRGGHGGDRDGERQPADAGEPVPDVLGEDDVPGPADRGQRREGETGDIDVALPGLGEQDDPDQGEGGPGEGPPTVTAYGGNGQRAEELHSDGGPERDPTDRGEEADGDQTRGDAEPEQAGDVAAADGPERGAGEGEQDERSGAEAQPGGPA